MAADFAPDVARSAANFASAGIQKTATSSLARSVGFEGVLSLEDWEEHLVTRSGRKRTEACTVGSGTSVGAEACTVGSHACSVGTDWHRHTNGQTA